jgi:hypothetical protein
VKISELGVCMNTQGARLHPSPLPLGSGGIPISGFQARAYAWEETITTHAQPRTHARMPAHAREGG